MKSTQTKPNRGYLFRFCHTARESDYHLKLAEMQRQAKEWEKFLVRKGKTSRLQVYPDWELLAWESWRLGTLRGASYVIGLKHVWISLVGPEFESWAKIFGNGNHWPRPEHSDYIACKGCSTFTSWAGCYRGYGSKFYHHIHSGHCPFVYSVSHPSPYNLKLAQNFPP